MAARAAELGDRRREQPRALGEAARHPGGPRRAGGASHPTPPAGGEARARTPGVRGASRSRGDLAPGLLPAPDRPHVVRLQGRDRPTGSRGERRSRRPIRWSGRSRPASSSSATPTRPESFRPCRARQCSAATAPTSCSGSCTPGSRPTAVPPRQGGGPRGGGAARRQDGRPLAERRPARALAPDHDDPELGGDPHAEQRLPLRRRSAAGSSALPVRTRGAPTRGTRLTRTAASTSACTG